MSYMNKGYVYGIGVAIVGAVIGFMLARQKRLNGHSSETDNLKLAGVPDQLEKEKQDLAQLENAKMVSEGSQFGVKYYNEVQEDVQS